MDAAAFGLGDARWLVRLGGNAAFVAAARATLESIGRCAASDPVVWHGMRDRLAPPERATRWRWDDLSRRLRERFDPSRVLNPGLLGDG
jgi:FAD/FMN-containing dehydrogenase